MDRRAFLVRLGLSAIAAAQASSLAACGPSEAEIAASQQKQCFLIQKEIAIEMAKVKRVRGSYPDVGNIVRQLHSQCPAGGSYSFDGVTEKVSCSIHGVAK